jgi:hypothetical protein
MSKHSDTFIDSLFCSVKMVSARSRKSFSVEEILAESRADTLSDGKSDVLSESDDDIVNES